MPAYRIEYQFQGEGYVDVEAETEDEAIDMFTEAMEGDTYVEWGDNYVPEKAYRI